MPWTCLGQWHDAIFAQEEVIAALHHKKLQLLTNYASTRHPSVTSFIPPNQPPFRRHSFFPNLSFAPPPAHSAHHGLSALDGATAKKQKN